MGLRSNGKSFATYDYGIERAAKYGEQFAIIRRWTEDFRGKRGQTMFQGLVDNGNIKKHTNGKWTDVYYQGSKWYFAKFNDQTQKIEHDQEPFAYAFSLSSMEHDKSTSYPKIRTVIFDE